ncbi:hypothetical protein LTH96_03095 [Nesterenkonia sp. LB17]|uniref:hypothetical protein n=1 Tax=Nesterenkonia sp. LB17 TaxID=2901230 RepID=UPI001F4CFBC4|nr:hypothetical protein [Nesterenkonia sp. LB17]MCH8564731.1 hypothetical protein [Nesterenkonia sp. LB17]
MDTTNSLTPEEVVERKREKRRAYQRAWVKRNPGKSTEYARAFWYRQFLDDLAAAEHARDEESRELLRSRGIDV